MPFAEIRQAWSSNKDGAGFAFFDDKKRKFYFEKGFLNLDKFIDALKQHEDKELAIHLRLATHGKVSPINCHPFVISKKREAKLKGYADALLMHNGILSAYGDADNSDSWHFAREALAPLGHTGRQRMLDTVSGRFILADKDNFYLFGLSRDKEASNCFYSNTSYQKPKFDNWSHGGYRNTSAGVVYSRSSPAKEISLASSDFIDYDEEERQLMQQGFDFEDIQDSKNKILK